MTQNKLTYIRMVLFFLSIKGISDFIILQKGNKRQISETKRKDLETAGERHANFEIIYTFCSEIYMTVKTNGLTSFESEKH